MRDLICDQVFREAVIMYFFFKVLFAINETASNNFPTDAHLEEREPCSCSLCHVDAAL